MVSLISMECPHSSFIKDGHFWVCDLRNCYLTEQEMVEFKDEVLK